jgi:succinyl-CoA synthetase beta subunit
MIDRARIDEAALLLAAARAQHRRSLTEPQSKALVAALGIAVPRGAVVRDGRDAAAAAERIGTPVMVKVVAADLTHKSDIGGVMGPFDTPAAAAAACITIAQRVQQHRPDAAVEGFLIEAWRPAALEWILGLRVDPVFGPAIMFGLGGIYVDVLRQVSFRLAPLREQDIEALLTEMPAMRLLDGARGRPPVDRAALKAAIGCLSDIATVPAIADQISEIEINPLTVGETGVLALDALVVLRS